MDHFSYDESRKACFSLAHTIAFNGTMQVKLCDELRYIELNGESYEKKIKAMLKVLLSNFT